MPLHLPAPQCACARTLPSLPPPLATAPHHVPAPPLPHPSPPTCLAQPFLHRAPIPSQYDRCELTLALAACVRAELGAWRSVRPPPPAAPLRAGGSCNPLPSSAAAASPAPPPHAPALACNPAIGSGRANLAHDQPGPALALAVMGQAQSQQPDDLAARGMGGVRVSEAIAAAPARAKPCCPARTHQRGDRGPRDPAQVTHGLLEQLSGRRPRQRQGGGGGGAAQAL